ncbi:hypothetical protein L596_024170 [Steinernema carpocapsae]|uniref:Uncharacterized protein n=1 Tax=Steinernema carpocapsae TaxID=34508 RepID=A0A4U5MFZ0_STECR|nr:hypothetical protein L596_024170 [Steinernema carpocapsae]
MNSWGGVRNTKAAAVRSADAAGTTKEETRRRRRVRRSQGESRDGPIAELEWGRIWTEDGIGEKMVDERRGEVRWTPENDL